MATYGFGFACPDHNYIAAAYIDMKYIVMAFIVSGLCSYGLYSYGLHSYIVMADEPDERRPLSLACPDHSYMVAAYIFITYMVSGLYL